MTKEVYYVKSLEEDFISKTLRGKKKVDYQKVGDMVKKKVIKLNTKSFGRERRLSCTVLHSNYLKTYRPQGIIFQTKQKSDHIYPFDLVLLGATDRIIVHYYRIKDNLHEYYNHQLIPGFEKFIFKDFKMMARKISSPKKAWSEVNKFRVKNGYKKLPIQKFKLAEYNEAVFHKNVIIKPIALFGYRKNARAIAKKVGLPHFVTAKKFWENLK